MKLELFVAFRYLKAKRKQAVVSVVTFISILGVAAGVMALIIALALNTGFQEEFQKRILGATSHVNLLGGGGTTVQNYREIAEQLAELPGIVSVTPTVYGQSLLQAGSRQQPAVMKGIPTTRNLEESIPHLVEGSLEAFRASDSAVPSIILGRDLAAALVLSAGDHLRVVGTEGQLSPLGRMPRVRTFQVAAIFESGLWDYDANWALVPLSAAQNFFRLSSDEVSSIELKIEDLYQAGEVGERVLAEVGPGYSTTTWIELNRPLFSALRLEKLAMFIAIGLIILVASLNIITSLTLMVMEKNRDIAILAAMGGTRSLVTRIFMFQGLIIGLMGTLLGSVLGVGAAWYLDTYRVFRLEPEVYSIPYVPFHWTYGDLLVVSVVAVLISFLATLYPARAAARLDPVEALRYE